MTPGKYGRHRQRTGLDISSKLLDDAASCGAYVDVIPSLSDGSRTLGKQDIYQCPIESEIYVNTPVLLLVGGRSTEHDASLHGYQRVVKDILKEPDRFSLSNVVYIDRWGSVRVFDGPSWPLTEDQLLAPRPITLTDALEMLCQSRSFIFSLLHGNEGEDGCWQGIAETLGLYGNFGPVLPSSLGMNEYFQSIVATNLEPELRTPRSWLVRSSDSPSIIANICQELQDKPAVIKPNRMGASLLTTMLLKYSEESLKTAVSQIFPYDDQALVQEYIVGKEITCGVLRERDSFTRLPIMQLCTPHNFLGHTEKHQLLDLRMTFMPEDPLTSKVRAISERLFQDLDIYAFARFDFIVRNDEIFFLEVNTLPGVKNGSFFPCMLESIGKNLADLIDISIDQHQRIAMRNKFLPYRICNHK